MREKHSALLPIHEIKAGRWAASVEHSHGEGRRAVGGLEVVPELSSPTLSRNFSRTDSPSVSFPSTCSSLVRPCRPCGNSLFSAYKVPFDRPRSIKEGQISLYRLATSILESVFNGADPPLPPRRRRNVFCVSFSSPPTCSTCSLRTVIDFMITTILRSRVPARVPDF